MLSIISSIFHCFFLDFCVFRLLVCAIHGIRHSRNAQRMNHSNCSANGFSSVFGKATKKPTPKCSSGKCNGCNVKWLKEFEATWRMNAHVCTRIHVNLFAADFNWCRRHDCDNMRETYAIQKWTFCSPFTIIDNKNLQNDNYNYALCELHRKTPFDCFVPALLKFTVARTNALYFPRHRFVSHSFCSVRWFVKMRYLHRIRREWTQLIKRIHQIATAKRRKKTKTVCNYFPNRRHLTEYLFIHLFVILISKWFGEWLPFFDWNRFLNLQVYFAIFLDCFALPFVLNCTYANAFIQFGSLTRNK